MAATSWKLAPDKAAEVYGRFPPRDDMPPPGEHSAQEYFEALCQEGRLADAVVFLAHALPQREAVWWGCLCLWQTMRPSPPPAVDAALAAVVRWVREPSEPHCQAAQRAVDAAGEAPVGFLARAVTFCAASLTPPGLPVVPPPPYLAHATISGALQMAAARGGDRRLRDFLHWGTDVAEGKNRWS